MEKNWGDTPSATLIYQIRYIQRRDKEFITLWCKQYLLNFIVHYNIHKVNNRQNSETYKLLMLHVNINVYNYYC